MKADAIRELTDDELEQALEDTRKELFNVKIQHSTSQLEAPLQIRRLRRNVARIQTEASKRKKAQGV